MYDSSLDDDLLAEFRAESLEHLRALEEGLLRLEEVGDDPEAVRAAFRAAHSLKGGAGFMGRPDIERLTHAAEDLLDLVRQGEAKLDRRSTGALLAAADRLRGLLEEAPAGLDDPSLNRAVDALRAELVRAQAPAAGGLAEVFTPSAPPPRGPRAPDEPHTADLFPWARPAEAPASGAPTPTEDVTGRIAPITQRPTPGGAARRREATLSSLLSLSMGDPPAPAAPPAPAPPKATAPPPAEAPSPAGPAPAQPEGGARSADTTIRVDVSLLDELLNLVGELVIARNRMGRALQGPPAGQLTAFKRIDQLTSDLQARATKTRMRPISAAWASLPRTLRDLCAETGKEVRLELSGQETELDRSLLEAIKDPLLHIVRNAVDHGIESPEVRRAAGKAPAGLLRLRARQSGGMVLIEATDDGKGMSPDAIRDSAVRKGLLTEAEARALSPAEALDLIFRPGFSTAAAVTRLSGRGVGMDVVRTQVRQVGGTVELQSAPGEGTTVRLRLPLTLAIVPALVVEAGGASFCIPQGNLVEIVDTVRLDPKRVSVVAGALLLRLRDRVLPLLRLDEALGLRAAGAASPLGLQGAVVVCEAEGATFGLVVDALHDTEEIVVKPLSPELKGQGCWAGATVRGDGSLTLILDLAGLARAGRVMQASAVAVAAPAAEVESLLRVRVEGVGFALLPLASVLRCADLVDIELMEQADERLLLHAGRLVPLRPLGRDVRAAVICARDGRLIAVGVSDVVEVVREHLELTPGVGPRWSRGSAVVRAAPAAVIDLDLIFDGGAA
jgi:two-component system chemotaxis sensor kinase CheA